MNVFFEHYEYWGPVVVMVVVAPWILYRFVAPKTWRAWAGAGIVQAFIIAFYAEMFGFPIAISFYDLQEFHLMPDKFHFMPDKFHLMPEPTSDAVGPVIK